MIVHHCARLKSRLVKLLKGVCVCTARLLVQKCQEVANELFFVFMRTFQECNLPSLSFSEHSQHSCACLRRISFLFAVFTKDDDALNIPFCFTCSFCGVCLCFCAFVIVYRVSNLPLSSLPLLPTCLLFTSLSASICLHSFCFLLQVFFLLGAKEALL